MISLENKQSLEEMILSLKSEIEKVCEEKNDVFDLQSLSLWNIYQKYIFDILNKFPIYKDKNESIKKNIEILDFLKIDEFNVDAKDKFNNQQKYIIDYADNLLEELKK